MTVVPELVRGWYVLALSSLREWPADLGLPVGHFCAFVACDVREYSDEELYDFAASLLRAGAVYICAWGPGCSRLERAFDDAIVRRGMENYDTGDDCIPTTSHPRETVEDALDFFRDCARPSPAYEATTRAWIAVSVGNAGDLSLLRERIRDPFCSPPERCG